MNELVDEVARRIAALPKPANGQVRAVPDDRTIRYYGTIGLLDRPAAMRGRTALYERRHVAQVVAIKRLQTMGRSLAEIQAVWPTLDDETLQRMSGVELGATKSSARATRKEFWKREPQQQQPPEPPEPAPTPSPMPRATARYAASSHEPAPVEVRLELAPNLSLSIAMSEDVAISLADVAAIRAAAAPLIAELARRRLAMHDEPGRDV